MGKAEQLRRRFEQGDLVVGGHVFFTDAEITEQMGLHGYDFVWIDGEHSALDLSCILGHIIAASSAGCASFVRVAWNDPVRIKPVLEMGPDGIILPMVCTKEDAEDAVKSCTYPLEGVRSFGPRRANNYGAMSNEEYFRQAMSSFLRIIQIEHRTAVKNLKDILTVEGIDLVIVGPNDLSASYGHLGNVRSPEMMPVYDEIAETCKAAHKPFGISLGPGDKKSVREWTARGISVLACGDDVTFISEGCKKTLNFIDGLR